jgi:hypothetical protein
LNPSCGFGEDSFLGIVHFVKLVEIKVRSLDDFDLSDLDVLNGIDRTDFLGDLLFNDLTGEEIEDLGGVGFGNFFCDDFVDLSSDDFLLWAKGIISLALLICWLSSESYNEYSQNISVLRLNIGNGFNESFSLFDEWAELISSGINTIETGDGLSSFSLIDNKLDFSPMESVLVGGKISLHLRYNSSFNAILNFFYNKWRWYWDLEFCWRMWNRKIQTGKVRVLWAQTTLFWRGNQQLSSFVLSFRKLSCFCLEPLINILNILSNKYLNKISAQQLAFNKVLNQF